MDSTGTPWVSRYSSVAGTSRMDLTPAETTATGVRASSANVITVTEDALDVTTLVWSAEARDFLPGPRRTFAR